MGCRPCNKRYSPRAAPYGRALPLQERPPLQAAALAAGLPLAASQRATVPCGLTAGAAYARWQPRMLAAAPTWGFGHGRPPPYKGPWSQSVAPCSRPGRRWSALHGGWSWLVAPPHYLCCENTAIMRKTILRDSISSHVVLNQSFTQKSWLCYYCWETSAGASYV
ncbi:hypothetical protein GW17_00014155 [Ensete ventricosum]|nr:hypothetical protein GW17_00014155 [Ensete ventricosum]